MNKDRQAKGMTGMFSARKLDLSALTDIEEDVETSASEEEQGRGEEIDDD